MRTGTISDKPFLDNRETNGIVKSKTNPFQSPDSEEAKRQRIRYNNKRSARTTGLKKQNLALAPAIAAYLANEANQVTKEQAVALSRLKKNIEHCCLTSLYRVHHSNDAVQYIGSHTCKHKACQVCNANSGRTLRRKYRQYFEKKPNLLQDYDLMHLTLTVPHTEANGWRDQEFYATELIRAFWLMRKQSTWRNLVHAGEFGVEVTRNNNGLHVHIHSLVLVEKGKQNRNRLHQFILTAWNKLTVDPKAQRTEFAPSDLEAIRKGNKLLTDADMQALNPQGSTLIGLESLYVYSPKKQGKFDKWDADRKAWKHYVLPAINEAGEVTNFDDLMPAVMECLKYHFEPLSFKKEGVDTETGEVIFEFDVAFLAEMLPKIYRKPLYQKFGAFRGVKELNINKPKNKEEEVQQIAQELAETAQDVVLNPVTLEEARPEHYSYFVANAASVYHAGKERNYQPYVRKENRKAYFKNIPDANYAIAVMMEYALDRTAINAEKLKPGEDFPDSNT